MKESIFSKKRILLLGSGELGKELVIESKRLGLEVIAIDRYEKAPAMQLADYSRVIDMGDKNTLKNVIKEKPKPPDKLNTIKFIQCYLQRVNFFRHAR